MQTALRRLLEQLEEIGDEAEELFDSEVREAMGDALFEAVIKAEPGFVLPASYGLSSPDLNARVALILSEFADAAAAESREAGLDSFHKRLAVFQDPSIHTAYGNDSDEFFGSTEPSLFDEHGNIKAQ